MDSCEGFIGIAEDLCQCDAQYRSVLQSLLGRIVVARDLGCRHSDCQTVSLSFSYCDIRRTSSKCGRFHDRRFLSTQCRAIKPQCRTSHRAKKKLPLWNSRPQKPKRHFRQPQRTIKAEQAIEHAKNMLYQRREETVTDTSGV